MAIAAGSLAARVFLDDAAAFVNDTDMRLVEGNIEANKKFHGLNSLIGCNEGHGPNVAVWRKARSAHLYRQAQIYSRQVLISTAPPLLIGWVVPPSNFAPSMMR